jgi:hypothetical protein
MIKIIAGGAEFGMLSGAIATWLTAPTPNQKPQPLFEIDSL